MAKIVAFVKASYLDKKKEARVIIEYTHLYERWPLNTGIKVNPEIITCKFDEDTELWKLSGLRQLKSAERKKLSAQNDVLRELNLKITRTILELKSKSLPLSASNIKLEFNRDPKKRTQQNNKSILTKQILEEFRTYLEELKLGGPTVHKQFKNLRIFLNWIAAHDETDEIRIPSAYKKFKVKARYGDPIGLTSEQFFQFYKLDLSNRKYLERTRDVFSFAVSIGGPRHGDLKRLADTLRKNGFSIDKNTISYQ